MASAVVRSLDDLERYQRLRGAVLDDDGQDAEQHRAADEQCGLPGEPAEVMAGEGHPDQREAGRDADQDRTEVVDLHAAPDEREVQVALQNDEADHRERDADVEAPAPAEPGSVDDDAADERAADGRDGHHGAHVAGVPAAVARWDRRTDDRLGQRHQTAHGQALQDAGTDQERHVVRHPGQGGADHEQDDRELHEQLLAHQVGQLAPDRSGHRRGQQAGRQDPRVLRLTTLQIRDDRRQRIADDRRAEHRREQRGEQPDQDLEDLPMGEFRRRLGSRPGLGDSHQSPVLPVDSVRVLRAGGRLGDSGGDAAQYCGGRGHLVVIPVRQGGAKEVGVPGVQGFEAVAAGVAELHE